MAATAGGVAIGSVVGHGMSRAIFGGPGGQQGGQQGGQYDGQQGGQQNSGYGQPAPGQYGQTPEEQQQQQQQPQPCEQQMLQFVQCAMNASDVHDCDGYLDYLKKCREEVLAQNA